MLSTQVTKLKDMTTSNKTQTQIQRQTHKLREIQKHDVLPILTKWNQLLDEFPNVFEPPSPSHPHAIQYCIELLDPM